MEAEFVNVFVEKQRDVINDLMARNIMLEARIVIAERGALQAGDLATKLAAAEGQVKSLHEQNSVMNQAIANQKPHLDSIPSLLQKIDELEKAVAGREKELKQIQVQVNTLTLEKENQRAKAEKIKKKVEQIALE